ncbi:MAG: FHA domain-containing protein, partial [Acidobacteria bacterium]|nr:FHA domain-containing protein [Acidobacteriota bacterium]
MPDLIVKYPDRASDTFPLGRLRITIGRSARNDLCIPDPFASRVHAEVRREGDEYVLQDLGSANGTLYNGAPAGGSIPLAPGDRIQIGETEILFDDGSYTSTRGAKMITDGSAAPEPEATIALHSSDRTTSGLLEAIEGARTEPDYKAESGENKQSDLLALISKVGVTLLASATLDETLNQIASLVFEAVPSDRCLIMMRDEGGEELKVAVARLRDREGEVGEIRVSRHVLEEVVGQGKSVLTSDAQH